MKFQRHSTPEPEINLIPFIDVLLVVLIFLMLTTCLLYTSDAADE